MTMTVAGVGSCHDNNCSRSMVDQGEQEGMRKEGPACSNEGQVLTCTNKREGQVDVNERPSR
jgi:hypothetical protein